MKLSREKSCCFTGHRILPQGEPERLHSRLREEISRLAEEGVSIFLAGGALGFDTLAAQAVLELREEGVPQIKLVLVLPCLGQESKWSREDANLYQAMLRQADEVIYTGDLYTKGCMFERNRYLVDHSAHCICYLRNAVRGGTAYTVKYAWARGLEVVNLAEEEALEGQETFF